MRAELVEAPPFDRLRAHSRDVSGAYAVAVGDGGQSLYMNAQQLRESPGLDLAELRELLGDMRHRAVVLAQLLTAAGRKGAGDVAVLGQRLGQRLSRRDVRCRRRQPLPVALLHGG